MSQFMDKVRLVHSKRKQFEAVMMGASKNGEIAITKTVNIQKSRH